MSALAPTAVLLLLVWGTLVALDLVSVPQAMLSRPLVAGTVAGWLAGDVDTIAALHRADPAVVHRINLGGIHHRPGRRERLPYVYLTDEELRTLESLRASGADVTAQDLPTTAPVALKALA